MAKLLENTVAFVTGASSGIGEATALKLAAQGAAVVLVARRQDRLDQLARDIEKQGRKALVVAADISDKRQAFNAVDTAVAKFGRLDTVINNAGVMYNAPTLEIPLEDWELMLELNVKGLMYVVKAALPHLLKAVETGPRRVADVVNISSVAGRFPRANSAGYNATKFGVTGATEAWRQEFTKRGVRFSVVEPGAVDTELPNQRDYMKGYVSQVFAGVDRLHSEDVAEAIAYIVTQPRRVAVNEIVIRPSDQV
jgi:NADP-dependent 3-hydroxy acid dehydrogenase YdfG